MRSTAAVTGRAQCAGSSTKPWSTTLQAVEAAAEACPEIRLGRRRKAEASSQVQDVPFSGAIWPTVMQLGGRPLSTTQHGSCCFRRLALPFFIPLGRLAAMRFNLRHKQTHTRCSASLAARMDLRLPNRQSLQASGAVRLQGATVRCSTHDHHASHCT